jgi:hypothetical protein
MARTAVELPDPLENAAGGGSAAMGGTDDLLAQLAGDEVDRLLSEADAVPPDPAHADRPPLDADAATEPGGDAAKSRAAMEDLFDEMDAADAVTASVNASKPKESDKGKSAQAVIEERADALVERARREADEAAVAAVVETPEPQDAPPSAAAALAAEMDADEAAHQAALARMMKPGKPAPTPAPPSAVDAEPVEVTATTTIDEAAVEFAQADDAAAERVPLLVRVLEFLNAPLAGLSAGVREALGKIAIVTAVNAVAVLVYVLIFRRH